ADALTAIGELQLAGRDGQSSTNSFRQSLVSAMGGCSRLSRMKLSTTRASISVRMKQRYASSGVQTIGSPRTLNDVFTTTGQPVRDSNARMSAWYSALVSSLTVCTRAE